MGSRGGGQSTGLGLDNVTIATQAAGGVCFLTTYEDATEGVHTVFHSKLPARLATEAEQRELVQARGRGGERTAEAAARPFPTGSSVTHSSSSSFSTTGSVEGCRGFDGAR